MDLSYQQESVWIVTYHKDWCRASCCLYPALSIWLPLLLATICLQQPEMFFKSAQNNWVLFNMKFLEFVDAGLSHYIMVLCCHTYYSVFTLGISGLSSIHLSSWDVRVCLQVARPTHAPPPLTSVHAVAQLTYSFEAVQPLLTWLLTCTKNAFAVVSSCLCNFGLANCGDVPWVSPICLAEHRFFVVVRCMKSNQRPELTRRPE